MEKHGTSNGEEPGLVDRVKDRFGDAAEQVKETASHVASGAREKGEHLMEGGVEKFSELSDRAETAARSRAETEKHRIATGLHTFAEVVRSGSRDLTGEQKEFQSLLNSAADRADRLSSRLESRDVDAITDDVRRFAQEHTSLFLGGAFALGFLGSRLMKSSEQKTEQRYEDRFTHHTREGRLDRRLPEIGTRNLPSHTAFESGTPTYDAEASRGGGYE